MKSMSSFDPEYVRKQFEDKVIQPGLMNLLNGQPVRRLSNQLNADNQNQNQNNNNNDNNTDESKQNDKQKEQPLTIPRFLEKFSNTFFRKTDPKLNPNEYYKQKEQEYKQKQEEKKQKQQQKKITNLNNKQVNQDQESQIVQDAKQMANQKRGQNEKHGRSVSSIAFDYSSFQQNSSSKFGFANELMISLRKGTNNLFSNFKGSSNMLSQQGLDIDQQNDQKQDEVIQIPNTESDEFNTNQNMDGDNGVLEFETEESERVQNINILQNYQTKRSKEQQISFLDSPNNVQKDNGQKNNYFGNKQSIEQNYQGSNNQNKQANSNTLNQQIQFKDQQINKNDQQSKNQQISIKDKQISYEEQQNEIKLIKSADDDDGSNSNGQLNIIIEEKSILDQTNQNNGVAYLKNQYQEQQINQLINNQNKHHIQNSNENIQQKDISKNLQNQYEKNLILTNNNYQMLDFKNNNEINLQENANQHRRSLSAQLSNKINFNKQPFVGTKKQDSTNKLPLEPFEEENSVLNESQQSHNKQENSSVMSCSRMDKSNNTCLVCFDKQPDSVFMDCGHGGVCYECALEIWKKTGECYLCRLILILIDFQTQKIVQVLQVDLKSKVYGLIKVISSTQMVQKEVDESASSSHQPLEEIIEDIQE